MYLLLGNKPFIWHISITKHFLTAIRAITSSSSDPRLYSTLHSSFIAIPLHQGNTTLDFKLVDDPT